MEELFWFCLPSRDVNIPHAMGKLFTVPAFLLMLVCCVVIADDKKQIFHECKPFPYSFFDSVPFLLDFTRCMAWFFGNLFNAVYFVLNTVIITVCEIISNIFSCLKYAIKLVEYLGCGVKAILQLNYNVVSSIFSWLAKTARFVTDSARSFAEGIISGIASVFEGILSLIRAVISCIPSGFYRASHGAGAAKNATGVLLYQSYLGWKYVLKTPASALLTVATSIRAVTECLIVSVWNTGVLLMELLYSVLASIFLGIELVGKAVQTCALSSWHQIINILEWFWYCIQALLSLIAQLSSEVCRTFIWVFSFIFGNMWRGFYLVCTSIWTAVSISLIEIGRCFLDGLRNIPSLIAATLRYLPGGKWTLLSFVSSAFLIAYSWTVFRVNIFTVAFGFLETSLQGVLAFIATLQTPSFPRITKISTECKKTCNAPTDEKDRDLKEQLERERDKNLCVVCQTEEKNIVVMPCRHMCMCKSCCTQLFRIQRYARKTCPLCRHTITSTLEIYA